MDDGLQINPRKRSSIIEIVFDKVETWNKAKINATDLISKFVPPRNHNKMCDGEIIKCNTIKRVIHLLEYYIKFQYKLQQNEREIISIYEYISSLPNYGVAMFMDDLYQFKRNHFKTKTDFEYFKSISEINCNNNISCVYVRRLHRDRNEHLHTTNEHIDYKNIILMEQLDSVHSFIFHSTLERFKNVQRQVLSDYANENDVEKKERIEEQIWLNNPTSIRQCNVEQIVYLLNDDILEKDALNQLKDYKNTIIQHVKDKHLDGNSIFNLKRKGFIIEFAAHCNNKKLKPSFGKLFNMIKEFDLSPFVSPQNSIQTDENSMYHVITDNKEKQAASTMVDKNMYSIWSNNPTAIKQCNVEQIIFIVHHSILHNNKVNKLRHHEDAIISCIKNNNLDGNKIMEFNRKSFIAYFVAHLGDKKLSPSCGQLFNAIKKFNVSSLTNKKQNSKYITSVSEKANHTQYYAFGKQYRYADNFKTHRLYVKARYNDIKQEIIYYFERALMESQFDIIRENIQKGLHEILGKFIEIKIDENGNKLNILWCDEVKSEDNAVAELIALKNLNSENLIDIITHLFAYLPTNFKYFDLTQSLFYKLLNVKLHLVNEAIKWNLQNYIQSIHHELTNDVNDENPSDEFHGLLNSLESLKNENELIKLPSPFSALLRNVCGGSTYLENYLSDDFMHAIHVEKIKNVFMEYITNIIRWHFNIRNKKIEAINKILDICCSFMGITENMQNIIITAFYAIMKVTKIKMYDKSIRHRCQSISDLQQIARQWCIGEKIDISWCSKERMQANLNNESAEALMIDLFDEMDLNKNDRFRLHILRIKTELKKEFIQCMRKMLNDAVALNNKIHVDLEMSTKYEKYVEKAKMKSKMNSVRQMQAKWYHGINQEHGIMLGDIISINCILALICYTDDSELCTAFRETYRPIAGETIQQQKSRHSEFAHFGKAVYESFVFYASKSNKIERLYHGMSVKLVFPTLHCVFDQPTSTTTEQSKALSFANDSGIVLQFESCESDKYIRTLDMSLFSCYVEEEEHLIFETRLRIASIFVPREGWFPSSTLKCLLLYDLLVHGSVVHDNKLTEEKKQKKLTKMLQKIIDGKSSSSAYVNSLIHALTTKKKKIWLNPQQITQLIDGLKKMFIQEDGHFGSFVEFLKTKYNVVICPIFKTKWVMTGQTFDLISRVSEGNNKANCCAETNTNIRLVGEIVKCTLSKGKQIVFRPEFTTITDVNNECIFNVKMELVDVFDNIPIKVHFNLQCQELDNYYTSLHPRTMDVEGYNHFNVTLPAIDGKLDQLQATELEMTIMLHNFDDFDIDCQDLDALNTTVLAQSMEQSRIRYQFADFLSIVYGFSNGIISIMDSISDYIFIVALWYYTDTQEYDSNKELKNETDITRVLFVLSIGNLISLSTVIASYFSYHMRIEWWRRMLCFCLFLILSPILPAFQYIWSRLKHKNDLTDVIEVSLQYDGILVWYKHELFRNKIFLIECIIESCFQVLIQFIAVYALSGLAIKDTYLYSSIIISLLVIISKLILLSYNLHRIRIFVNV
eukprot:450446_1